jgi:hypothetical protein
MVYWHRDMSEKFTINVHYLFVLMLVYNVHLLFNMHGRNIKVLFMLFLQSAHTSSLIGPNMFLITPSWNFLNIFSPLMSNIRFYTHIKQQAELEFHMFQSLDSTAKIKRFWSKSFQAFPEPNPLFRSSYMYLRLLGSFSNIWTLLHSRTIY